LGSARLLANHWFIQTGASGLPIGIVDVDAALDDRYIFVAGSRHAVRAVDDRRPDYLLIAPDPTARTRYRVRALECKGTSGARSYAVRQLASAVEQLAGICVGGRIPQQMAHSPEAIADAQFAFAERLRGYQSPEEETTSSGLYSATPDSSIFSLSLE
jgi:hypothetical protein